MDVEIDPLLFLGLAQNAQRESLASSNSSSSKGHHRGQNFTEKERLVLLKLVERFPAISCKRITMDMRVKKQQSWNKLTKLYNIQPGVTRRTLLQLKTAWLNSRRMASRAGANSTRDSEDTNDNELSKDIDPNEKLALASITIKEPSEFKAKGIKHEALSDDDDDDDDDNESQSEQEEDNESGYLKNEEQAKIKRVLLNMQQDAALFNLKRKRESLAIEREANMIKYEKAIHELTIKKMELEIQMHSDKNVQVCEKDNPSCNGADG